MGHGDLLGLPRFDERGELGQLVVDAVVTADQRVPPPVADGPRPGAFAKCPAEPRVFEQPDAPSRQPLLLACGEGHAVLAVANQFAHGGNITASNRVDGGASFRIVLPQRGTAPVVDATG